MSSEILTKHYDICAEALFESTGRDSFLTALLRRRNEAAGRSARLCIPYWQRDYDWTPELIHGFFSALKSLGNGCRAPETGAEADDEPLLRLGTMVLGRHAGTGDGSSAEAQADFLVVDGQQRLRTLHYLFQLAARRKLLPDADEPLTLPLHYGVGRDAEFLDFNEHGFAAYDALPMGVRSIFFANAEQWNAFLPSKLEGIGLSVMSASEWLRRIRLHLVIVTFRTNDQDGSQNERFERLMSALFSRINLQAKPLDDIDIIKAQFVFELRKRGRIAEAARFADDWETARSLILLRAPRTSQADEAAKRSIQSFSILSGIDGAALTENFGRFSGFSEEDLQVWFSRYLHLVCAIAKGADATDPDSAAFLRPRGILWQDFFGRENSKKFPGIDVEDFAPRLRKTNDIFLRWRPFLLISRRHLAETVEPLNPTELEKARWLLLRMQCFVSAGNSRRSWFSEMLLQKLLKAIERTEAECRAEHRTALESPESVNAIRRTVEAELFKRIGDASESSKDGILCARDWFLWLALFEDPSSEAKVQSSFRKGLQELLQTYAHFSENDADKLADALRSKAKKMQALPSAADANEIEHWIALDGKTGTDARRPEQLKWRHMLMNQAHIGNGMNQSLSNKSVKDKAARCEESWWPTLQFLAGLSALHDGSGIAVEIGEDNDIRFLRGLKRFWSTVAAQWGSPEAGIGEKSGSAPQR